MGNYNIPEKLKIIRDKFNVTQAEFAEKIGMKQSQYSLVENGKQDIQLKTISEIYDKYGVSPVWMLMTGDTIPTDKEIIMGMKTSKTFRDEAKQELIPDRENNNISLSSEAWEMIKQQIQIISSQQEVIKSQQRALEFFSAKSDFTDIPPSANIG